MLLERRRRGTRGRGQRRADDVAGVEIGSVARQGKKSGTLAESHRGARRSELGRTSCSTPSRRRVRSERRKLHDGRACLRLPLLERRARATVDGHQRAPHLIEMEYARPGGRTSRFRSTTLFLGGGGRGSPERAEVRKRPAVPCMVHDSSSSHTAAGRDQRDMFDFHAPDQTTRATGERRALFSSISGEVFLHRGDAEDRAAVVSRVASALALVSLRDVPRTFSSPPTRTPWS